MRAQHLLVAALVALLAAASVRASVEISADATKNMNCTGGVCSPTAKKAVLNATDLANMLATSDVKIVTGSGAVTITVSAPFSWTSTHRLTLDANLNVSFRAPVVVAGQGAVTIVTNDGGIGGDLIFFDGGNIGFWDLGSSLIINDKSYTLVKRLKDLRKAIAGNPTGFFALAGNYNAHKDGIYSKTVIGTIGANQTIEGLGNQILNLTIASTAHPVLALIKENRGVIRDLGLTNVNVSGPNTAAAGIARANYGTLSNVYVSGTITGADAAGLTVGNGGTITHSYAAVDVSGGYWAGGITGANGGLVQTSYAAGSVTGVYAGGITGLNVYERSVHGVSQCYSSASVSAAPGGHLVGGLIGVNQGNITNSYASGQVNGGGGAIGENEGYGAASIYSTGFVFYGGGLVGYDESHTFRNSYWDLDTSGQTQGCYSGECNGVTGLTDAQLKSALPAGFDPALWGQSPNINNGYPYLLANPPQ